MLSRILCICIAIASLTVRLRRSVSMPPLTHARFAHSRVELPAGATHQIVRDYLVHYGYADTLAAFDSAAGAIPGAPDDDMGQDAYVFG